MNRMGYTALFSLGNVSLKFHFADNSFFKRIKNHYYPHFSESITFSSRRVIVNNRSFKNLDDEPDVNIDKNGVRITRSDFNSVSDRGFSETYLEIENNIYSFDSWLRIFITLIGARKRMILLHSSGVVFDGSAVLFPAVSGSGKSTIIRKLGAKNALSDELSPLFANKGCFYSCYSPFWGELKRKNKKRGVKSVSAAFFPQKSTYNGINKLKPDSFFRKLLKNTLFFLKDAKYMESVLSFARLSSQNIRGYDLHLRKDASRKSIIEILTEAENEN